MYHQHRGNNTHTHTHTHTKRFLALKKKKDVICNMMTFPSSISYLRFYSSPLDRIGQAIEIISSAIISQVVEHIVRFDSLCSLLLVAENQVDPVVKTA